MRPLGPTITGVVNGAGGQLGAVPCGLALVLGTNLAPGIVGSVVPNTFIGPLPTRLANVEAQFGSILAPLFSVSNVDGREQIALQVPCGLSVGTVTLTVRVGQGSGTFDVQVIALQPGVFQSVDSSGALQAVILRTNGTLMSRENPLLRGEQAIALVTGLGQVTSATFTNVAGIPGQRVNAGIIIGVNNAGVPLISAEYAPNMIGVYLVRFEVPGDTTPGVGRPFAVAAIGLDGSFNFGNGSAVHIQ